MKRILVTGGAGYIGSHAVQELIRQGFAVIILDNLSTGFREAVPPGVRLVLGDVLQSDVVLRILQEESIDAVMHFAAKLNVAESTRDPLGYYENNTVGLLSVLKAMMKADVRKIVFSSTAAVYGDQVQDRAIQEGDAKRPLNPYGSTKLMSEDILEDVAKIFPLKFSILRYFNVAGASEDVTNGQRTADAFHLIHLAVQAACGKRKNLQLFGSDYPTADGTCVRDYIHVQDLADIHVLALKKLLSGGESSTLNCGYGHGYSVREVIKMVQKVSGVQFPVIETGRRPGDAASLIADSSKLKVELGWRPLRSDLELICRTAYQWEKSVTS